ncbi:ABC transporter permease [Mycobacterium sp. Dal123C01]|uniref:ABC transporter permease n=1 Tax=Mycobacterium sp. Dal123C01 TaxID=3457577 RepID=UPI00403E9AEB
MTSRPAEQGSLLIQSWLQAVRLLLRWRRDRATMMGSLLLPIFLLLLYQVVLGEQVRKVTGVDSLYGLVPFCAVLSALFGALGNAVGITMDRQSGLLSRMWVLPVHRTSALTGRLTAEAARSLLGTVLITALGVAMGLRFTHGWVALLLYILIPSIMVVGFTAMVIALVLRTSSPAVLTWIMGGTVTLAFVNPGTTPIGMFPDWLRPFVRFQPISPPIETMRALAYGGPIVLPLAITVVWMIVMLAIFVPIGLRGYRICAETSNL